MKLLNVTESAIILGITKELLFAYVRYAPKKHLGETRKLNSIVKDGQNYFTIEELKNFDEYLKIPWSKPNQPRPPIPVYIKEYLKVEIFGKCPISGKGYPLEDAHIIPYNESFSHHHHNILRIAKDEHTKIDTGVISRQMLRDVKDRLIETVRTELEMETANPPSFYNPPHPHHLFIGRFPLLLELIEAMETERMVVLQGLGGIGKTQLLLNALDNVKYHRPVKWIDVETIGSLFDLKIIMANACAELGTNIQSDSLVTSLNSIPVTFVLDSMESLLINERDATEDFISTLISQTSTVQLLITSQIDLKILDSHKKVIKVELLTLEESEFLFMVSLEDEKIEVQTDDRNWLLQFCNGHPLSIKLTVSLIKFYKSAKRTIGYLSSGNIPQYPVRNNMDKGTSLDVCLSIIYNCLTQEQVAILQYVKFFPGGLKYKWAEEHFKQPSFDENTAVLQQFFFVEMLEDSLNFERIIIPNPIRPFLKKKAKMESAEKESDLQMDAISSIMMEAIIIDLHYVETGLHGPPSYGMMRIEDEMPNLLEAFNIAKKKSDALNENNNINLAKKYCNVVAGICSALGKFCFTRGYFNYGSLFAKAGIEANIRLQRYKEASSQYVYLAQIQQRQFDLKGLEDSISELERLTIQLDDKGIKADFFHLKGKLEFELDEYDNARKYWTESLENLEEYYREKQDESKEDIKNEVVLAASKNDLGNICILKFEIAKTYEFKGEYKTAIPLHREIIKLLESNFLEEEISSNYHHYAHCLCRTGDFDKGFDYYYKAIKGFKTTGQFEYLANSISDLGLFIEDHPTSVINPILDEDVYLMALQSVSYQLRNLPILKKESIQIEGIPITLLNKILWLIKAISFSNDCFALTRWVSDVVEEFSINFSKPDYLNVLLNLAHSVGGINEWKLAAETREKVIKAILQSSLLINGGPDLISQTRIFYWLSAWMKHTGINTEATPESLLAEAWNSLDR
jgi:tetratricopeptide (TPR) repeat protein